MSNRALELAAIEAARRAADEAEVVVRVPIPSAAAISREREFAFTRGELRAAFDSVADRKNWKGRIRAWVTLRTERDRVLVECAVQFFAGCRPTLTRTEEPDRFRVEAVGYYRAVGA